MDRYAEVTRKTGETDIVVKLDLDGSGVCDISTGVPFFDHMLNAFGRHGLFDLTVHAVGDVEVDAHHTVEDTGIVLGEAFCQALGDKAGITRFADAAIAMDETLVMAAVDISGRGLLRAARADRARGQLRYRAGRRVLLRLCARRQAHAARARAGGQQLASHYRGRL